VAGKEPKYPVINNLGLTKYVFAVILVTFSKNDLIKFGYDKINLSI